MSCRNIFKCRRKTPWRGWRVDVACSFSLGRHLNLDRTYVPTDDREICFVGVLYVPAEWADYFQKQLPSGSSTLPLTLLWSTLFELLLPIWPARTSLSSHPEHPLGDVWPCPSLDKAIEQSGKNREEGDNLVAFHKLTQWLCYSLVEGIESEAGWKVDRGRGQTGLPEVSRGVGLAKGSIEMEVC